MADSLFLNFNFYFLILFGYLVGSLSPGYFFGRIVKGVDIRKYNRRNTGATNTYLTIGPAYGVITGVIDFLKAPFAYYAAVSGILFNIQPLNPDLAILAGLAAVAGHISPFYLSFRGGRGVASLYGLTFASLFFTLSVYALALFAGTIFYAVSVSQRSEVKKILAEAPLRKFLKLCGLVLPLGYLLVSAEFFTNLVLILLIIALSFDVLRFLLPGFNQKYLKLKSLAKGKEFRRFSGYTIFLFSAYLLFRFFPGEIAAVSLSFFIIGDVFAPFGLIFMAKEALYGKTWGGAFLVFTLSFIVGLFMKSLVPLNLSLNLLLAAAFLTALLDQLSFLVDDNILVPLGTAVVLILLI